MSQFPAECNHVNTNKGRRLSTWVAYICAVVIAILLWIGINSKLMYWAFVHIDLSYLTLVELLALTLGGATFYTLSPSSHDLDADLADELRSAQGRLRTQADPSGHLERDGEDDNESLASSRVEPAWSVARTTLAQYWNRNLNQNRQIFIVSVIVSCLGFAVTVWGVGVGLQNHEATSASIIAAASGAITQIIGTTLLLIFRSNAAQAKDFNITLERINSVGMAWYVLQTMTEETPGQVDTKNGAKAALVRAIVSANVTPRPDHDN